MYKSISSVHKSTSCLARTFYTKCACKQGYARVCVCAHFYCSWPIGCSLFSPPFQPSSPKKKIFSRNRKSKIATFLPVGSLVSFPYLHIPLLSISINRMPVWVLFGLVELGLEFEFLDALPFVCSIADLCHTFAHCPASAEGDNASVIHIT